MFLQTVITIVLLLSIVGIAIWFYNRRNEIERIHRQTISELERAISTNGNQIRYRNSNLNGYDFQRYNLDEALVVQSDIEIH